MSESTRIEKDPILREAWAVGFTHVKEDRVANEIVFYSENKEKHINRHEFIDFISSLKIIRAILWDGSKYSWVSDANGDGDRLRNFLRE